MLRSHPCFANDALFSIRARCDDNFIFVVFKTIFNLFREVPFDLPLLPGLHSVLANTWLQTKKSRISFHGFLVNLNSCCWTDTLQPSSSGGERRLPKCRSWYKGVVSFPRTQLNSPPKGRPCDGKTAFFLEHIRCLLVNFYHDFWRGAVTSSHTFQFWGRHLFPKICVTPVGDSWLKLDSKSQSLSIKLPARRRLRFHS